MNKDKLIKSLQEMNDSEILEIVAEAITGKVALPEVNSAIRNHFLLCVATSSMLYEGRSATGEWDNWELFAVALPDSESYPGGVKVDGICQSGTCPACAVNLYSTTKDAICPVCESKANLT